MDLKIDEVPGEVRFAVHAKPRSRRSKVEGIREGALEVALHAVPEKGAANDELIELLSEVLGVPKRSIRLLRGETSRHKHLAVSGITSDEVRARLAVD